MTYATVIALDDGRLGDGIRALLRQEDGGVAIGAGQPFRVRLVRESHVGHRACVLEDDVEVDREHVLVTELALPRIDIPLLKDLHPIDDPSLIAWKIRHGLHGLLKDFYGAVVGVMYAVFSHRHHFARGLKVQPSGPDGTVLGLRDHAAAGTQNNRRRTASVNKLPPSEPHSAFIHG